MTKLRLAKRRNQLRFLALQPLHAGSTLKRLMIPKFKDILNSGEMVVPLVNCVLEDLIKKVARSTVTMAKAMAAPNLIMLGSQGPVN